MATSSTPPRPPTDPETAEDELWFLPGPPEDIAPTDPPWPIARPSVEFKPPDWIGAEAELGRSLADATAAFARLDERLRTGPIGLSERLALMEIADQLWAQGDWIPVEKLALYRQLRLSTLDDAKSLSEADWAVRRVQARQDTVANLVDFLARREVDDDGLEKFNRRPVGVEFAHLELKWRKMLEAASETHPLTQAAVGYFGWRSLGMSEPGAVLEPLTAVAAMGTGWARGGLRFLPVALGDRYFLGQSGKPKALLQAWLKAIENGCLRGQMQLDRLIGWQRNALYAVGDLSGKTPPVLVEVLLQLPVVSTEIVADRAKVSKVSALRNLTIFESRGLVREVTGQTRYRFWSAKL